MTAKIDYQNKIYTIDFSKPIDISIPLRAGINNVNAWYAPPVVIEPVVMGNWVGDVNKGGSVNFRNVFLNPHAHGTHTECAGHISKENFVLNDCLKTFFFGAQLISVAPVQKDTDLVITLQQIKEKVSIPVSEAVIIRTMPNENEKLVRQYSNTNPPYLEAIAASFLADNNVKHLLIDLPSIDKEKDDGVLAAHHTFWQYPQSTRKEATITELIFVDNTIEDGFYFLNLQVTSLVNDASPSKPVLYKPLA